MREVTDPAPLVTRAAQEAFTQQLVDRFYPGAGDLVRLHGPRRGPLSVANEVGRRARGVTRDI